MADNSEVQKLTALLVKAKVDKSIIDFMQDNAPNGLEIKSLSDFVDYVTHNLYQTELQSEILDYLPKEVQQRAILCCLTLPKQKQ